mmetsp:Transcript_62831/g.112786  ORF Transcript_62831/g.112786 Transcript_62831/m.112786 type:complete len:113 (+) Transcript_62831:468-806(+)
MPCAVVRTLGCWRPALPCPSSAADEDRVCCDCPGKCLRILALIAKGLASESLLNEAVLEVAAPFAPLAAVHVGGCCLVFEEAALTHSLSMMGVVASLLFSIFGRAEGFPRTE